MKKLLVLLFFVAACSSESIDANIGSAQYTQIADVALDTTSVFLPRYPVEQYVVMTQFDRPLFADVRSAAFYKGTLYLAVYGSIIKIDTKTNKVLAFSNPALLPFPKHVIVQNDKLFVANGSTADGVEGAGIFQIDVTTEQIEWQYNKATGLKNTTDLRLYSDGIYIWAGTNQGVGRIDSKTHAVKFYSTASELNSPCDWNTVKMHVRGTEVWAVVLATETCSGAALHYDRANDSWTRYDFTAFAPLNDHIDFLDFIVSDVGVFADYQKLSSEYAVEEIKKFDPTMGTWTLIGAGIYSDAKSMEALKQLLPPESTYSDAIITEEYHDQFDQFKIQIRDGNDWIGSRYSAAELLADSITKNPIANNYLIVNHTGLYIMSPNDVIPKSVVNTHALSYSIEKDLTFTADNEMLVVSHPYLEMVGNGVYQFIVYDQVAQSGSGFALSMNGEKYDSAATKTLVQNGSKLLYANEYGSFEIDLVAKTVVKTK